MRFPLFIYTAILFFLAQSTALVVADQLRALVFPSPATVGSTAPLIYFLIVFFATTLFFLILFQLYRGKFFYRLLFTLVAFVGLVKVFEIVFPLSLSLAVALIFIIGLYIVPLVWAHDIIVMVAAAGIGPVFGLQFSPMLAGTLLIILSLYDVVAVFITRHMLTLAHEMVRSQASFALLIPERFKDFKAPLSRVQPGSGFLILGGGDVVLPMLFTTSVFLINEHASYATIAGMVAGLFANHAWLMKHRRPLPALPFITLGAFGGLAVGMILGL